MPEPARARLPRLPRAIAPAVEHPGALDETVVHDPAGRPWLVCTVDVRGGFDVGDPVLTPDTAEPAGQYETQVYYTARAGIRGFPTGHGERYAERADAVAGHRRWCLKVRFAEICPDLAPEEPL
jgi:hypothetical protein